ncbi:MAG: hypothetical protein AAGD14_15175 [Planctomycetota bacterium]
MIQDTQQRLPEGSPEAAPPKSFFGRFLDLPRWEQYTAAAALACFLGWLGASGWDYLFRFKTMGGWFFTLTIIGAVAVLMLTVYGTLKPESESRLRVTVTLAMLPALGGLIELLQHFWAAVAFVAAGGMAYAAYKLLRDRELMR